MDDKVKKFLFDIKEAIESIESYLGPQRNYNEYLANKMLRRAIEREFEIIGEAVNQIDKLTTSVNISCKKQIIGMRNRVIHGYDKVDNDIVWSVIIRHLPVLKREIEIPLEAPETNNDHDSTT